MAKTFLSLADLKTPSARYPQGRLFFGDGLALLFNEVGTFGNLIVNGLNFDSDVDAVWMFLELAGQRLSPSYQIFAFFLWHGPPLSGA